MATKKIAAAVKDQDAEPGKSPHAGGYVCIYEGKEYSRGAVICQVGEQYKCGNGGWYAIDKTCPPAAKG